MNYDNCSKPFAIFLLFQETSPLAEEPRDGPDIDYDPAVEPEAESEYQSESQPASESITQGQETMEIVTVSLTKKKGNIIESKVIWEVLTRFPFSFWKNYFSLKVLIKTTSNLMKYELFIADNLCVESCGFSRHTLIDVS